MPGLDWGTILMQYARAIGWSITAAVGFAFGHYSLNDEMDQLDSLNQTLDTIRSEREALLTNYQVTLEKQAQHIDSLLLKLENAR